MKFLRFVILIRFRQIQLKLKHYQAKSGKFFEILKWKIFWPNNWISFFWFNNFPSFSVELINLFGKCWLIIFYASFICEMTKSVNFLEGTCLWHANFPHTFIYNYSTVWNFLPYFLQQKRQKLFANIKSIITKYVAKITKVQQISIKCHQTNMQSSVLL